MSRNWRALVSEAGAAAEHLAIGVTALGKANYAQHAYYTQAFFALSVGFERSAKIALVVDHALDHKGQFPTQESLKNYGHDLGKLLERMDEVAVRRARDKEKSERLPRGEIHEGIVRVLTDFATNFSRYYNLDLVTGATGVTQRPAPLADWHERVLLPVKASHYSPRHAKRVRERAESIATVMGHDVRVSYHAEDGSEIDNVFDASVLTGVTEYIRPYCRMYVMQICRFVSHVMSDLTFAAYDHRLADVPHLTDFYAIFNSPDSYFRSRKTWSIYGR